MHNELERLWQEVAEMLFDYYLGFYIQGLRTNIKILVWIVSIPTEI
jgi:hypothetical protein